MLNLCDGLALVLVGVSIVGGCGDNGRVGTQPWVSDGGLSDDSPGFGSADGDGLPADSRLCEQDGSYRGVRLCCGGPDDRPGANCLLPDVVEKNLATCVPSGSGFDLKDRSLGKHCCDPLVAIRAFDVQPDGTCEGGPVSSAVCLACGNGVCDREEDYCSCPADCDEPLSGK